MNENEERNREFTKLFEEALFSLKTGKKLEGKDGAMTPLIKRLLEASMEGEMMHIWMKAVQIVEMAKVKSA